MQAITINDLPKKPELTSSNAIHSDATVAGIPILITVYEHGTAHIMAQVPAINPTLASAQPKISIHFWRNEFASDAEFVNEINQSITRVAEAAKLLGATPKVEAA